MKVETGDQKAERLIRRSNDAIKTAADAAIQMSQRGDRLDDIAHLLRISNDIAGQRTKNAERALSNSDKKK